MTEPTVEPTFLDAQGVVLDKPDPATAGTVVALAGEAGRYTRFAICMQSLAFRLPTGTAIKWMLGSDIAESRNQAVEEMEGDWIWFIDDDHCFREDIVLKLLARDVDIITPICLRRSQPFLAVPSENGNFLDLTKHGADDLVEVDHAGSSGMLIRRRVIDALEPPWFELGRREGDGNRISEDVNFCRRAKEAGFKIHVDLDVKLGHMTTAVLWPVWNEDEERWLTGFTVADGAQLATDPAPVPEIAEVDADPS